MIVPTKGHHGESVEHAVSSTEDSGKFLALRCTDADEWVPIVSAPTQSSDEAVDRCMQHIRAQLDDLRSSCDERLRIIDKNLAHLSSRPSPGDVMRIRGQVCALDDDAVTIPADVPTLRPWRRKLRELPDLIHDVFEVLQRALPLDDDRDRAVATAIDHALEMPFDFLTRVHDVDPKALGAVAAFMVRLYQTSASLEAAMADTGERPVLPGGDS